ncbi:PQQ-binding-like beta-propeller repeat protein [Caulobacter sp. RL271]|uniref:PQQ-binding-like beta-propeller repeat protein n=1 Tax=Caulobacter segnis TaxID=88688 RepID=A0ABY4ZQD2_9CAUL|nr:PQQ-binding-like beta-propeller repeat protein [Caulobacter segnis]USQ94860.1 PQQ-binding-like beta-propeller repeat protein [Caulobacter segnis]
MPLDSVRPRGPMGVLAAILGVVLILIGLTLAAGGGWLLALHGSPYYLLAGLGLIVSGVLLILRRIAGIWVYAAVFAATLVWALWEVGLNGWALVPRLVGPLVLLWLTLACAPLLTLERGQRKLAGGLFLGSAALLVVGLIVVGIASAPGRPGDPTGPALAGDGTMTAGADWTAYGGTYGAQRYSTLAQITPQNAGQLKRAWLIHTGDLPDTAEARKQYGAETTPLKVGDALYVCTPKNILIALDAASGKERWRFDPKVPDIHIPYTAACRGVSYYVVPGAAPEQACAKRIIEGTLDARLIAVDAATGRPCADFGFGGQVDTNQGIGPTAAGMFSITSAPTIVRGVIVTGHQVLDGQRRDAPSGVIQGYDAVTGQLRWAWDMARPDLTGAPPAGQTYTRGTPNMWTTASGDETLGLVYLPLGNSAVDYWSGSRSPPEKAHSTSLVALDVMTGKKVWSFQAVHNDVWDYDLGSQATLVNFPAGGATVPALVLPGKQGDLYVLDRRTGAP